MADGGARAAIRERRIEIPHRSEPLTRPFKGGMLGSSSLAGQQMDLSGYTLDILNQDSEFALCRGRAIASPTLRIRLHRERRRP